MNLVLQYILKRTVSSFLVFLHVCLLSFSFVDYLSSLTGCFFRLSFSPSSFLKWCQVCYPGWFPHHIHGTAKPGWGCWRKEWEVGGWQLAGREAGRVVHRS